jgi:hypothetical protein
VVAPPQIDPSEVDALKQAFTANPVDIGIGIYNPQTAKFILEVLICLGKSATMR